ncbi:MAG TPA: hypothetical protein VHS09_09940, partial [Polyangiaceae bacterium]|nr:hypothetical protein [Polyangiaceae bacterium]
MKQALALGLVLGLVLAASGACHDDSPPCACPASDGTAVLALSCVPATPPVIQVAGPCSASEVSP